MLKKLAFQSHIKGLELVDDIVLLGWIRHGKSRFFQDDDGAWLDALRCEDTFAFALATSQSPGLSWHDEDLGGICLAGLRWSLLRYCLGCQRMSKGKRTEAAPLRACVFVQEMKDIGDSGYLEQGG